jgi:uncharacterized protein YndB with AHSA1/START domain
MGLLERRDQRVRDGWAAPFGDRSSLSKPHHAVMRRHDLPDLGVIDTGHALHPYVTLGEKGCRPPARISEAVQKSSTQQTFIDAPVQSVWDLIGDPNRHPQWWPEIVEVECADLSQGCRYRGVVKHVLGPEEHELVLARLEDCQEVSIHCSDTGVTTRFLLTEAQGGTFVEGYFSVEPSTAGMKVLTAMNGRRFLRGWLERSLANLKSAAERQQARASAT